MFLLLILVINIAFADVLLPDEFFFDHVLSFFLFFIREIRHIFLSFALHFIRIILFLLILFHFYLLELLSGLDFFFLFLDIFLFLLDYVRLFFLFCPLDLRLKRLFGVGRLVEFADGFGRAFQGRGVHPVLVFHHKIYDLLIVDS